MAREQDAPTKRNSAPSPPPSGRRKASQSSGSRGTLFGRIVPGRARAVAGAASGVMGFCVAVAIMMALEIMFKVFHANADNEIVQFVDSWARWLAWEFRDLFTPEDERVGVLVNYGMAGAVYLVAGRLLSGLVRRIG